ncbi:hypothetical protein CP533_3752 [Ophiocordyceps camponoti-saundersi (nom. inval.)]|nr:hypothetical protein CP533_3752 [Ophiocordyceps camponoti-saundersi (nom. inval.)]
MKCWMLLVALTALQRGVTAMPAETNAAPPTKTNAPNSPASGGELTKEATVEVAQGLQQSGLSQDKVQKVEGKIEQELKEKDTNSPKGVASIIGDISTDTAKVVPGNDNATQVPAVISVVQGAINSINSGESSMNIDAQKANALTAVAAAMAIFGESKGNVAKAVESAMKGGSGSSNESETKSIAKRTLQNINIPCSSQSCTNFANFALQMAENRHSLQFMAVCLSAMYSLVSFGASNEVFGRYRDQINGFSGGNNLKQLQTFLVDTTQNFGRQNILSPTIVNGMNNVIPLCFANSQFLGNFGQQRHNRAFGQQFGGVGQQFRGAGQQFGGAGQQFRGAGQQCGGFGQQCGGFGQHFRGYRK